MATAREQMKTIEAELTRVRAEMDALRLEEGVLTRLLSKLSGEPAKLDSSPRKRATNVKPLVLDLIRMAGIDGMTSLEVANKVREKVPGVAKDTVGSVLSRLKSAGAFAYVNDRYYEKQFAPPTTNHPFDSHLRAVG